MPNSPILIVGGAGKTGGRVHDRLAARGLASHFASRSGQVPFDWDRPDGWQAALDGVSRAYVTFQPDLAVEGAAAAIGLLGKIAQAKGLQQIVLLSGRGEPGAQAAEAELQASGVPWTIVRASWFDQNFSEGYLLDGVLAGEVELPAGDVQEPFIDVDDIADVVTAALTDPRHLGQLYEVTGPQALTFAEAVAEVARAAGRPLRYTRVTPEVFAASLRHAGLTDDLVDLLNELFTVVLDGRNSRTMDGVEQALGRPPRSFADYARAAAATGVWRA